MTSVLRSKFLLCDTSSMIGNSDLIDVLLCEVRSSMVGTKMWCTMKLHVVHVGPMVTQFKMVRSDAVLYSTDMQDELSWWDGLLS